MVGKFGYRVMYFIYDNALLIKIKDPYKILENIGLKKGMVVLDIGSGPGFYAIPALEIIGSEGKFIAIDIYPMSEK